MSVYFFHGIHFFPNFPLLNSQRQHFLLPDDLGTKNVMEENQPETEC
jgi:hypothetical protein